MLVGRAKSSQTFLRSCRHGCVKKLDVGLRFFGAVKSLFTNFRDDDPLEGLCGKKLVH